MKYFPFQQLSTTNERFAKELHEAACRVIDSGRYLLGEETHAFETELSQFIGSAHAVATANGLEAIRLIFAAYIEMGRLHPGDGVLVPANTFIASLLPLSQLGLRPLLVDPDARTMSVSLSKFASEITPDVKAVLAVHLYGLPSFTPEGLNYLRSKNIILVEDNAQAIGAEVFDPTTGKTIRTGNMGDAAAFSFYPAKNIGALGDGGAVTTSDSDLAKTIRQLSNYGGSRKYHYDMKGFNSRMDEIQAAFLRVKLPHTMEERERREAAAAAYDSSIEHRDIILPSRHPNLRQAWHQYVVRTPERDRLARFLTAQGVETMIHYPIPPHLQKCYVGQFPGSFPIAEKLATEILSLPIANINSQDAIEIAQIINSFK